MKPTNFILALLITLIAILPTVTLSNKVDMLQRQIAVMAAQLDTMQESTQGDIAALHAAVDKQQKRVSEYSDRVDKMIMSYRNLDEILKHMFDYEQSRYMERVRE